MGWRDGICGCSGGNHRAELRLARDHSGGLDGVVYLLAVLLVSSYWGLWLGLFTALASTAAFNFFHLAPEGAFDIATPEHWVALAVFFVTAVVTSTLTTAVRSREEEAERRRREAALAADMARLVLGGSESTFRFVRWASGSQRPSDSQTSRSSWAGSTAVIGTRRSR